MMSWNLTSKKILHTNGIWGLEAIVMEGKRGGALTGIVFTYQSQKNPFP